MYTHTLTQAQLFSERYDIDLPYAIAMVLKMQSDEQAHKRLKDLENKTALKKWVDAI